MAPYATQTAHEGVLDEGTRRTRSLDDAPRAHVGAIYERIIATLNERIARAAGRRRRRAQSGAAMDDDDGERVAPRRPSAVYMNLIDVERSWSRFRIEWLTCDFDELACAIRAAPGGARELLADTYGLPFTGEAREGNGRAVTWDPARLLAPDAGATATAAAAAAARDYAVYLAAVVRLTYTQWLAEDVARLGGSAADVRVVRELQDQCQPLTLYAEMHEHYDDESLRERAMPDSIADGTDMFVPAYQRWYPDENKALHWGETPDVSMLVAHMTLNSDLDTQRPTYNVSNAECLAFSRSFVAQTKGKRRFRMRDRGDRAAMYELESLMFILRRAFPQRSATRGFAKELVSAFERAPSVFHVFVRMLAATLLGVYAHSAAPADFTLRRAVYRWFSMEYPSFEELRDMLLRRVEIDAPARRPASRRRSEDDDDDDDDEDDDEDDDDDEDGAPRRGGGGSGGKIKKTFLSEYIAIYAVRDCFYANLKHLGGKYAALCTVYRFDEVLKAEYAALDSLRRYTNRRLETVTWRDVERCVLAGEDNVARWPWARATADRYGAPPHEGVDAGELLRTRMPRDATRDSPIAWHLAPWADFPRVDRSDISDKDADIGAELWSSAWFGTRYCASKLLDKARIAAKNRTFNAMDVPVYEFALGIYAKLDAKHASDAEYARARAGAREACSPVLRRIFDEVHNANEVTVSFLAPLFCVSWENVEAIETVTHFFVYDTHKSRMLKELRGVLRASLYDFNVIRVFFEEQMRRASLVVHAAPTAMLRQQLLTMCRYYGARTANELPLHLTQYYVCMHCRTFCANVVNNSYVTGDAPPPRVVAAASAGGGGGGGPPVPAKRHVKHKKAPRAHKPLGAKDRALFDAHVGPMVSRFAEQRQMAHRLCDVDFLYSGTQHLDAPLVPRATLTHSLEVPPPSACGDDEPLRRAAVDELMRRANCECVTPVSITIEHMAFQNLSCDLFTGEMLCDVSANMDLPEELQAVSNTTIPGHMPRDNLAIVFFDKTKPRRRGGSAAAAAAAATAAAGDEDDDDDDDDVPPPPLSDDDDDDDIVMKGAEEDDDDDDASDGESLPGRSRAKKPAAAAAAAAGGGDYSCCQSSDLTLVNVIGRIIYFYGNVYALCPYCLTPTMMHMGKYDALGFSCAECLPLPVVRAELSERAYSSTCAVECYLCPEGGAPFAIESITIQRVFDDGGRLPGASDDGVRGVRNVPLCESHAALWAHASPTPLPMLSTVLRNLRSIERARRQITRSASGGAGAFASASRRARLTAAEEDDLYEERARSRWAGNAVS